jgi:hypothetical protein
MTKKNKAANTRITITQVKLPDLNEEIENFDDQMTAIEIGYSEEVIDDDDELQFVKEYPKVKFRNFLAHPDLLKHFNGLRPHMSLICEFRDDSEVDPENMLETVAHGDIYVTDITLVGSSEKSGVVLGGFKILRDGSKLKLVTPAVRFDLGEYEYGEQLSELTDEIMVEARHALIDKKHRIIQMELFPDEDIMNGVDTDGYPLGNPASSR